MSSTQPAPVDRQLPAGILVLNRSFRRTLETENKGPGPSRPTATCSSPASFAASTFRRSSPTSSPAGSRPPPIATAHNRYRPCTPSSSGRWPRAIWRPTLARLLKTCEGRDFASRRDTAVILLLVDTGMRRAECAGMALADVDLDQRIVWILGKGRRPRALPIGRKTTQALDRYLRTREGHRLAHLPHLCVGRNWPMTPSGIYQVVHDRARAAGLPAMHPHQLMRTAVSLVVREHRGPSYPL